MSCILFTQSEETEKCQTILLFWGSHEFLVQASTVRLGSSEENETLRDGRSVSGSAVWNNFTQIQLSGTKGNKHVQWNSMRLFQNKTGKRPVVVAEFVC